MKSPFPGMDPYLEKHWRDVHASLIIYTRDHVEDQLPDNLIARVEERVVFETDDVGQRGIYPDVRIAERATRSTAATAVLSGPDVAEPVIVQYDMEPATETFINIIDPESGHRLVTVIEILSLANKLPGEGQRQYREKQQQLREAHVSLVEIDLLRKGNRGLSLPVSRIPPRVRTTYQVCVRRGWTPGYFEIYPVPLRRPLPIIRIPLRETDVDIRLDLQAVFNQAYRKGRYYATINYQKAADPPLRRDDAKWAKSLMKKAKRGA